MRRTAALAAAAVAVVALGAGCGSGAPASHAASPAPANSFYLFSACNYMRNGFDTSNTAEDKQVAAWPAGTKAGADFSRPGGLPVVQTVPEGHPFTVTYQYSTGGSATWKIALDSITCGRGPIFSPKILARKLG